MDEGILTQSPFPHSFQVSITISYPFMVTIDALDVICPTDASQELTPSPFNPLIGKNWLHPSSWG